MIYVVLFFLVLFLIWFFRLCYKYRNPYRLYMVFGKKGAGKTTYLTRCAVQYAKRGRPVYSTVHLPYARKLKIEEIGYRVFPPESVLLIDEVGMIWDNRNFKNFKPEVRDYFKLQRHYRHTVYLFSQSFDVDLKIRNLTDKMFLLVNPFGWFSIIRSITRSITVTEATSQGESKIADQLHISGLAGILFGSTTFLYIPRYVKYFDSYEIDDLPAAEGEWWDDNFQEIPLKRSRITFSRLKQFAQRKH